MFSIGSTIGDKQGNLWIVTQTWTHNGFLCVALIGAANTPMAGQMGGARFRAGDEIYIKR